MKPAKFSQVTRVKTAVLFSQLYIRKNLLRKEFWKLVYGWNLCTVLFGTWTLVLFPHAGAQLEIFQGRGGFVELWHFDKHFVKNTQKKDPAGKNFGVFSPRSRWNYISNKKFIPKLDTIKTFFPRALFLIF